MASTTLRDYLRHTEDAISAGRLDNALANCQRILSHFPESLEAQRLLGEVYLAQGNLEDAQQTFDWILINDPENVVVYCDRALICERLADIETALDCYQQAYELSRGDSQMRQEFNKLSAKAGQPGFMFSRAGLARLYMRGDLLPQAIQEWEIILSTNPDRLDARAGLLETYWREGLYEQVEELATSILNDVPGCMKALLLLAHVTSMKDMQQAQDLLQRASVMDPELLMAQELFSDLIASQPNDPFLPLLHKGTILLPEQTAPHAAAMTAPTYAGSSPTHTNGNGSQNASSFSDSLVSWSNLDTLMNAQQQSEPEPDIPTFAWSSNSAMDINPWSTIDQPISEHSEHSEPPTSVTAEPEQETLPVAEQSTPTPVDDAQTEGSAGTQTWKQAEESAEPEAETYEAWSSISNISTEAAGNAWRTEAREENAQTSPPAWLDMLTKSDRRAADQSQARANNTPVSPTPLPESVPPASIPPTPPLEASPVSAYSSRKDGFQMPGTPLDDEEELSFGPEWLKSLGAAVIEEQTPVKQREPATSTAAKEPEAEVSQTGTTSTIESDFWQEPGAESWMSQLDQSFQADPQWQAPIDPWADQTIPASSEENWQVPIDPWLEQLEQAQQSQQAQTADAQTPMQAEQHERESIDPWTHAASTRQAAESEAEQSHYATLEALEMMEREMYAQGFVPLEPGSLSAIAEDETLSSALSQLSTPQAQPANPVQEALPMKPPQPVRSAQTRPLPPPVPAPPVSPVPVAHGTQPEVPASEPVEEPLWLPTPGPVYNTPSIPASRPIAAPAPVPVARVEAQLQLQAEQFKGIVDEPVTVTRYTPPVAASVSSVVTSAVSTPQISSESALDSELEMTMRRPIVRLQPMAQKSTSSQSYATSASRGRTNGSGKGSDGNLSYKERLLKGYHYQLAGDYDEAMQEYRVIIRNAPELLGEVISNMRALLKLAPKYAPGYRVLGDAYMRQGEYLHAMEAYNKALTMTKKGQGNR
ncbi:MAG TPA: tetratricopeptide repeat protein [Ktedonobacteraceae bacterium]|nr:tetratricopeptide repeat protein [Ktedonobacteraceae bacterium]